MENLELNHTYLIKDKRKHYGDIKSITVNLITEKTYYIKWNYSHIPHNTWKYKNFISDYDIIEDITELIDLNSYVFKIS